MPDDIPPVIRDYRLRTVAVVASIDGFFGRSD
jgi:hypothetical protein